MSFTTLLPWFTTLFLVLSSLGVILAKKPVHSGLSFLLTLLLLSCLYLELSAQFIAVMQVLVYAGAILVIFMFVIILFQDAHEQISKHLAKSNRVLILVAALSFLCALGFLGKQLLLLPSTDREVSQEFGTVQSLGQALYIDFFFPFEAIIFLFLVAIIGAVYIAKKSEV